MKHFTYALIFFCFAQISVINAQDVVWAKSQADVSSSIVNVSDNSGNLYVFYQKFIHPDAFSFLKKFDNNGNLLFTKQWSANFSIKDVKYDGASRLFATGFFTGNITVDGKNIVSKGEEDAFLAELDLSGTILSVKTFGGKQKDISSGIFIKTNENKIFITGEVNDTVNIDNTVIARQKQSMFIASFNKPNTLIGFQFYDFIDSVNNNSSYGTNYGTEIAVDNSGNIFTLHFREGRHPLNEATPLSMPEQGLYVMKTNSSGTILWSQFIINGGCYYGYGASALRLNQDGDAFVKKWCSGKYGGTGTVMRLNGANGSVSWTYSNTGDPTYYDMQIDNTNSLILLGNEGGNPCPCEDHHYGYDVIKKFSSSNSLIWEKRYYDIRSNKITLDHQQNIFLTGSVMKENTVLGKDTLAGGEFLAKIINGGIAPTVSTGTISGSPFNPGASVNVPYTVSTTFSSGNIFTAQLSDPFGSFKYASNIGSLSSIASGTINATIPSSASPGTAYRIRVVASNPLRHGTDNGTDITISGGSQPIIAANSSWKYLDNGSNQGTAWKESSFNDGTWKTGNAQLGYGDGDEVTVVSYGPNSSAKYITTYFRKTVSISNPSQFTSFNLALLRDDGAVVYVNGAEVVRSNMSSGTIAYTTLASSTVDGSAESSFTNYTIAASKFVNGNNTIAVEIHQANATSSDISFNLTLTGVKSQPSNELIAANSSWKYLDNGTYPSDWRYPWFDDTSWKTGNAELGYGDGDEATVVSYGPNASNKYITTYFRKKFNADASGISGLKLEVLRDDGAIVYLNGIEVFRNNLPSGNVFNNTLASNGSSTENVWLTSTFGFEYLRNGENIIGVEIHQDSPSSSDISFNLKLSPTSAPPPPPATCSATGNILREYWTNIPGDHVSDIPINSAPNGSSQLSIFEGPVNSGDNYGARIRGFICPPISGNYIFWISSDDDSELWLSTNDNPSNKVKIASVTGWTNSREWTKYPSQQSAPVNLVAGTKYYIEALHKEALGGDNIAVGWQLPGGVLERPIPGSHLSPATAPPPPASDVLIAENSSWKYLDNGSDQGTTWRNASFNDGSWKTGNAELGYGDGDEATVVSFGSSSSNKFITTYFRKSFNVDDVSAFTGLELSLLRDDGAVVYINGTEVFRSNMPSGTIAYTTLAPGFGDVPEGVYVVANIGKSALVNGSNVIAVEIHQESPSSSDISFNLKLKTTTSQPPVNNELVAANSSWKYLDNGTNQGTAWRAASFNDGSWNTGNAELGYGDGGEATVVSYGGNASNKYITTYFRKSFTVADASAFSALELSVIRDDGIVVYLNGTEVYRNNMPSGTVFFNTLAPNYIDGSAESAWVVSNISKGALVTGNNVISVEIHQNSPSSSDISFNLKLKGLTGTSKTDESDLAEITEISEEKSFAGNEELLIYDFIVYPNPTTGSFTMEYCRDDVQENAVNIEIINSAGQQIFQKRPKVSNGCIREVIELEKNLPFGIYMVNVLMDKNITESRRILLTK